MSLKGMITMVYMVMMDKATLFKNSATPKLFPTRDTINSDIKSETEFDNYIIGTTPGPKLRTIFSCTSLHLPPWLLDVFAPHI